MASASHSDEEVLSLMDPTASSAGRERKRIREPSSSQDSAPEASSCNPCEQDSTCEATSSNPCDQDSTREATSSNPCDQDSTLASSSMPSAESLNRELQVQRRLEAPIQEEAGEVEVGDYLAIFDNAVITSVEEIYQTIGRIERDNIHGLAGKIYAILNEDNCGKLKNYDQKERSFYELRQECDDESFKGYQIEAAGLGMRVCHAIVYVRFLISQNKENELVGRFQAFEGILRFVDDGEETVVVRKILDLIREAEIQLERDSEKAASSNLKRPGKEQLQPVEYDKSFFDEITCRLLQMIFMLELFWVHKRLPSSRTLAVHEFPALEYELSRISELLKGTKSILKDSVLRNKFGTVSLDWKKSAYYKEMESKIDGLWHVLAGYEEMESKMNALWYGRS